jgi:hypothetical protein
MEFRVLGSLAAAANGTVAELGPPKQRALLVVHDALAAVAAGERLPPFQVYDLASGLVEITYSGGFLEGARPEIDDYRRRIVTGELLVPCIPDDRFPVIEDMAAEAGMTVEELLGYVCP